MALVYFCEVPPETSDIHRLVQQLFRTYSYASLSEEASCEKKLTEASKLREWSK